MASIFQSLSRTLLAGLVLLVALVLIVGAVTGQPVQMSHAWGAFFMRWLHVLSGVMWIGLLWYLNFVQIPTVPKIEPMEHRAAITKFIAPSVLFWFRYGALATVVTGLLLAWMNNYIVDALTLQKGFIAIGLGMWMALVMAFNVWFIIWPNQKKALGIVDATPEEKAAAAKLATMTSRFNTMFSVAMLYFMVAQQNGGL